METTELMVSLVVSLLTTIFIYLIVPTIIILCGKKYTMVLCQEKVQVKNDFFHRTCELLTRKLLCHTT